MTRRRFYAPPEAFSLPTVELGTDETRHLRDVLRLQRGDEVYVFDGQGNEYRATIAELERSSCRLEVLENVNAARPESPLNLILAVALLKGDKFDLVVQKAVELGVKSIIPVITQRADVIIRNEPDAERKRGRWQRIALEATKQCGRAFLMKVEKPASFSQVVDQRASDGRARLMFTERDGDSFENALSNLNQIENAVALIGSEGGFADDEIEQAHAAGWKLITLGGRIMRAETAAIVIAGLLQHRFGDLR